MSEEPFLVFDSGSAPSLKTSASPSPLPQTCQCENNPSVMGNCPVKLRSAAERQRASTHAITAPGANKIMPSVRSQVNLCLQALALWGDFSRFRLHHNLELMASSACRFGIAAGVAVPTLAMCQQTRRRLSRVAATDYTAALRPVDSWCEEFLHHTRG